MERPLSGVERMMYLHSEQAPANGFSCVRLRGPLDEVELRRALERLPHRHPLLAARVIRNEGVLTFTTEAVAPIPLRVMSDDGSGQTFLEVAAAELVAALDRATGPLARFTLVRHQNGERADLVMTVDHTIADGTACLYAMRDLLTPEPAERARAPSPLPPLLTHQGSAPVRAVEPPPALPPPDARPRSTSLFAVETSEIVVATAKLASEPMQALARRCKERGVTVHAAACAAFGAAFAEVSGNRDAVVISSPVSYRHRLDPAVRDTVSCSIAFAEIHLDLTAPGSFWDQALAVRQQLLAWTADDKIFAASAAIEEASRAERDDVRFLERTRQGANRADLSVSNLGRQPIPSHYGDVTIDALHGAACLPGDIAVNLFTLDETMHITWATSGLSRAANDAVRRMVASAITRLGVLPS
ncbi:MAG TPA: hypothetical protein VNO30_03310 [Kofleriaceae bacterium]|nr:hypothetical protein [Kofleriaceae bacterium]